MSSDHQSTINSDGEQDGEALDAELLPEEFPDDRPLAAREYGTTEAEQARREPLDKRLRREIPDVDAGTEADPDDTDESDESPDLLAQFDENGHDLEKDLVTQRARERDTDDSGQPRSPRSAEEDAIHVIDEESPFDDD